MARNVLLIIADQWRGDCLGALGHPAVRTPNLDALAANPAHAALLNEARDRMLSWRLRHADRTLTRLCATPEGLVDRRG